MDHRLHLLSLKTDHLSKLTYPERERIHKLKYYACVEQQRPFGTERNALWYGPVWRDVPLQTEELDVLIRQFSEKAGLPAAL